MNIEARKTTQKYTHSSLLKNLRSYNRKVFASPTKISENTTNILNIFFQINLHFTTSFFFYSLFNVDIQCSSENLR